MHLTELLLYLFLVQKVSSLYPIKHSLKPLFAQIVGDSFVPLKGVVMEVETVASFRQDSSVKGLGSGEQRFQWLIIHAGAVTITN
jgi:hypothetical protein